MRTFEDEDENSEDKKSELGKESEEESLAGPALHECQFCDRQFSSKHGLDKHARLIRQTDASQGRRNTEQGQHLLC